MYPLNQVFKKGGVLKKGGGMALFPLLYPKKKQYLILFIIVVKYRKTGSPTPFFFFPLFLTPNILRFYAPKHPTRYPTTTQQKKGAKSNAQPPSRLFFIPIK